MLILLCPGKGAEYCD